jgi:tetratricopeptide (TPR) repeat protein
MLRRSGLLEERERVAELSLGLDWDWAGAERELKRAIELNSNFVNGRAAYANLLVQRGRFEEAACEVRLAKELDPLSAPLSAAEGRAFFFARRYDQAIAHHRKTIEIQFHQAWPVREIEEREGGSGNQSRSCCPLSSTTSRIPSNGPGGFW